MKKLFAFILIVSMVAIIIPAFELSVMAESNLFNLSNGAIRIGIGSISDTIKVVQDGSAIDDNIPKEMQITITGDYSSVSENAIYVAPGVEVNIKLDNVNISVDNDYVNFCALNIDGGNVLLELSGKNTLKSGYENAGLRVPINSFLTVNGSGSLNVQGGYDSAGIGGNRYENCGAVTINSGTVIAQCGIVSNGSDGAGIGGGWRGAGGKITINGGTVTATAVRGMGIGNGYDSNNGGSLTMNGNAVVFVSSVSDDFPKDNGILFIGNDGVMYGNVTIEQNTTIPENKVLTLKNSITLTIGAGVTLTNNGTIMTKGGMVNQGGTYGTIVGSGSIGHTTVNIANIQGIPTPVPGDVPVRTITETDQYTGEVQWSPNHSKFEVGTIYTATIALTVKEGYVFHGVSENFFAVDGARSVTNAINSGEVIVTFSTAKAEYNAFDISEGLIRIEKGSDLDTIKIIYGYKVKDNIPKETQIIMTGDYSSSSNGADVIYVAPDVTANIKLNDLSVILDQYYRLNRCAFNNDGGNVTLELSGTNTLRNGWDKAGLRVPECASLTIFGKGSLLVYTYAGGGAGIGGDPNENGGAVTINSGIVYAYGSSSAAGIGGGQYGAGGTVVINGGTVTAYSEHSAAGIGGGFGNNLNTGTLLVNGGTLYANSGNNGPGISGEFIMNGNAVVFNQFVTVNSTLTKGIIFYGRSEWGYTGQMYGDVTIEQDTIFPSNSTLTIPNDVTLIIPKGLKLTNNGTIINNGTLISNGLLLNNGTTTNNALIVNDSKVTAAFTASGNAVIIIAFYDGNKLINMKTNPITISGMLSDVEIPGNANVIKVMLWDGVNTMQPLCETNVYPKDT